MGKAPPIPKELWDQIPLAAQAALLVVFRQYEQRIAQLEQRVGELEQRLGQNSSNSSRPPSSDAPAVKRPPPEPDLLLPTIHKVTQDGHDNLSPS